MIQLVMKPEKAPVVNHEGLYSVRMNGEHLMHIRAKNAQHAEKKLAYCFKRELSGKTLDFNLEAFTEGGLLEDGTGETEQTEQTEQTEEKDNASDNGGNGAGGAGTGPAGQC